jgi:transcription initiation factor TFIID subunit 13
MSQPPYPIPTSQYPAYPYPYHSSAAGQYGQTPATYPNPYQTTGTYGTTGVTGYGQWPYQYNYNPQQQHIYAPRPPVAGPSTSAPSQPQRSATFSAYTPSYTPSYKRENVPAAATGGATGRAARKQQANFKGVFAKER